MGRGKALRSLQLIDACTEILQEIQPATVRAVCYRLFTMNMIDSMSKNNTNRVGRQLVDAREAGIIPWEWIVDETRSVEGVSTWADPERFADTVTRSYRRNKWQAQPVRIEVWSEKGTGRGTLAPVLDQYEVPFRVMHGFASATTVKEIATLAATSKTPIVAVYAGDWDPSGLFMSEEDLPTRLSEYQGRLFELDSRSAGPPISIERVALVEGDVVALGPDVSFPLSTKIGDPRHRWYLDDGYARTPAGFETDDEDEARCWELDALSPVVLRERVEAAIVACLDRTAWDRYVAAEQIERESIVRTVSTWRELAAVPGGAA